MKEMFVSNIFVNKIRTLSGQPQNLMQLSFVIHFHWKKQTESAELFRFGLRPS